MSDQGNSTASQEVECLLKHALPYLYSRGFAMIPPSFQKGHVIHAPFSLLPRKIPRAAYERAYELANPYSQLVDAIARERTWLMEVLKETGEADEFTGRLMSIMQRNIEEGDDQPLFLGIHRSDYMIDVGSDGRSEPSLRQIELNTIASSFGCLSSIVGDYHSYISDRVLLDNSAAGSSLSIAKLCQQKDGTFKNMTRPSPSCALISASLARAHWEYVSRNPSNRGKTVAFVVQAEERNFQDQRQLEYALWHASWKDRTFFDSVPSHFDLQWTQDLAGKIPVRRVTLEYMHEFGISAQPVAHNAEVSASAAMAVAGSKKELLIPKEGHEHLPPSERQYEEVSVVYFRAGYTPSDYPSEAAWKGREVIEFSNAIKAPPISYHLVGKKKVQQALAAPGVVEKFLPETQAHLVRSSFAGLWTLSKAEILANPEIVEKVLHAYDNIGKYVVKPQREGGGNNLYGLEAKRALHNLVQELKKEKGMVDEFQNGEDVTGTISSTEIAAYILMERIFPDPEPAKLVRLGEVLSCDAICEFGVYSVSLTDVSQDYKKTNFLLNSPAGHLIRTKVDGTDEGGVAAGFAVLDSPILIE